MTIAFLAFTLVVHTTLLRAEKINEDDPKIGEMTTELDTVVCMKGKDAVELLYKYSESFEEAERLFQMKSTRSGAERPDCGLARIRGLFLKTVLRIENIAEPQKDAHGRFTGQSRVGIGKVYEVTIGEEHYFYLIMFFPHDYPV